MPARARVGDVLEISTRKGLAYVQVVFRHRRQPVMGDLIRVFPGFFESRPTSFAGLVQGPERFLTFIPADALIREGIITVVGSESVPVEKQKFPVFRLAPPPEPGKPLCWWLWDGEKEWKIGTLNDEQKQLPIAATWNGEALLDRVESGWSHLQEI